MTDKTPFAPIIRTQIDLQEVWRHLMHPSRFESHSVWLMVIGPDDRPIPQLTRITDAEDPPDEADTLRLAAFLRELHEATSGRARFAFLRSRPGGAGITVADRSWAAALYTAARRAEVTADVVHHATPGQVVPIPTDDALAASA